MKYIGTAGWSIPGDYSSEFPPDGAHLERYSLIFYAAEINSSFYNEHMPNTYERWKKSVPDDFLFSVKLNKKFIHGSGLKPDAIELKASIENIKTLGDKLGVILVQLPGSMSFEAKKADRFFKMLRKYYSGKLVIEPRNPQWAVSEARKIYEEYKVSKVIADPEKCPSDDERIITGGGLKYYRLHGSPEIYKSQYSESFLRILYREIKDKEDVWCIFDNTTFGYGTGDALRLLNKII